jgi:hypothetical protein
LSGRSQLLDEVCSFSFGALGADRSWELSRPLNSMRDRQAIRKRLEFAGAGLKGAQRESMCQAAVSTLRAIADFAGFGRGGRRSSGSAYPRDSRGARPAGRLDRRPAKRPGAGLGEAPVAERSPDWLTLGASPARGLHCFSPTFCARQVLPIRTAVSKTEGCPAGRLANCFAHSRLGRLSI